MQKQTGGSAKPPVEQGLPRSCNHLLKNYLIQAAFHAGTTPHQAARRVPVATPPSRSPPGKIKLGA